MGIFSLVRGWGASPANDQRIVMSVESCVGSGCWKAPLVAGIKCALTSLLQASMGRRSKARVRACPLLCRLVCINSRCTANALQGPKEPNAMTGLKVDSNDRFIVAFCGSGTGHLTQVETPAASNERSMLLACMTIGVPAQHAPRWSDPSQPPSLSP